jgi:hypothetical protein
MFSTSSSTENQIVKKWHESKLQEEVYILDSSIMSSKLFFLEVQ